MVGARCAQSSSFRSTGKALVTSSTTAAIEAQEPSPGTWIFDVAMLHHTPLPFLIHDSAIIKLVGHAPVRALLGAYMRAAELTSGAGEPKQVFFSFDATKAYGAQAEELVEATSTLATALKPSTASPGTQRPPRKITNHAYNLRPLWKLLIDRDIIREDLRRAAGLFPATIAKLGKDGNVTTNVLLRICQTLQYNLKISLK